ncbi:MAG: D-glycero-beta-D-manno-heptose-7-phosphate kinase [Thermodesulfovibrionales bacterium]|nr:D-glycero-beta-D-manno-heptose-7-phosphate kinase [Thermodesulfovibrionales bacterium]
MPIDKSFLSGFKDKRILVIGDIILDRYIFGKVRRISPEAPVPVVEVSQETYRLGGALNVANNIVSLGGSATIVGFVGNDIEGDILLSECNKLGIDASGVIKTSRPTTVKTRIIAHNQQVVRVDREDISLFSKGKYQKLYDILRQKASESDGIIVSDYKKGVITREVVKRILDSCNDSIVSVDPKIGNFHCYKGVTIITPNKKEASHGAGVEIVDEKTLIKAGKILLQRLKTKAVLITRGGEGMSLFYKDNSDSPEPIAHHISSVARKVYDVTGAGDTVIAVFTLAHASGASLQDAAYIANCAAGIVVEELGTSTVSVDMLEKRLSHLS